MSSTSPTSQTPQPVPPSATPIASEHWTDKVSRIALAIIIPAGVIVGITAFVVAVTLASPEIFLAAALIAALGIAITMPIAAAPQFPLFTPWHHHHFGLFGHHPHHHCHHHGWW